jgi:ubiquinone/menaquinone biosynthesis C-methylase UbiE
VAADERVVQAASSYDFDRFSATDRTAELTRLRRQATLLLDREMTMLRNLGLVPGTAAAEVGCGPGFVTGALAELVAPGPALGIDMSAELLKIARSVVEPEHDNLSFVDGNAAATGLPDHSIDFMYNRLLYQHLDAPVVALHEAKRVLRPGGRVCVVDVDDAWLTLEPSCEAFDLLIKAAYDGQTRRGGDRRIGRKLPQLMRQAGFSPVTVDVLSISSLELGLQTFLDITTRFKAIQVTDADGVALVEDVYRFATHQNAFGVVGVFVVVGVA